MFNVNRLLATLLTLALMGAHSATQVNGHCGECQANGVACLDEEHFAPCFQNAPTTNRLPCPQGNVCTTEPQICLPATQGRAAACHADVCGSCTATTDRFACLDETRYGFCYKASQPSEAAIRLCPAGYVCNVKSLQICEPSTSAVPSCLSAIVTTTTVDPSTPTTLEGTTGTATADKASADKTSADASTDTATESAVVTATESGVITATESIVITTTESTVTTTTVIIPVIDSTPAMPPTNAPTTTPVPRQPNTLCADIGQEGNFKPDADSTCQRYIKCYVLSGQFVGWEYTCSPGYFSQTLGGCQSAKPVAC